MNLPELPGQQHRRPISAPHRTAPSKTSKPGSPPGPTTRKAIRTFIVFINNTGRNHRVEMGHYTAKTRPTITQDQRVAWLRELLTGTSESLPYRIAGILLLLYAQPLVRIAKLRADTVEINETNGNVRISIGAHRSPCPNPSQNYSKNTCETARTSEQDQTPKVRGSSREPAPDNHFTLSPPPLVADALGYSHQIAFLHADNAGDAWARYVNQRTKP